MLEINSINSLNTNKDTFIKGTLYIVATPIGNMGDITIRALETLKTVDLILSEDTRETTKLLNHYQIEKSQISYRDQNHTRVYERILEMLKTGGNIALVSDSGTPLISDPGFKLVSELIKDGIKIESIPGPSAVIGSLIVSGLPTDKFVFIGFLPKKPNQQNIILKEYGNLDATLVIYESPFRVIKLLEQLKVSLGNRKICIVKDLTKMHESLIYGEIDTILTRQKEIKPKGEYILLVAKKDF
jgi:16S rRNA (cytidine1402-2'-O)-methyltransferase